MFVIRAKKMQGEVSKEILEKVTRDKVIKGKRGKDEFLLKRLALKLLKNRNDKIENDETF